MPLKIKFEKYYLRIKRWVDISRVCWRRWLKRAEEQDEVMGKSNVTIRNKYTQFMGRQNVKAPGWDKIMEMIKNMEWKGAENILFGLEHRYQLYIIDMEIGAYLKYLQKALSGSVFQNGKRDSSTYTTLC